MDTLARLLGSVVAGTVLTTAAVLAWIAGGILVARALGYDPREAGVGLAIVGSGSVAAVTLLYIL